MKFRWTERELKESSDDEIIRSLLAERMYGLNPYGVLHKRLQKIYRDVDKKINTAIYEK